MTLSRPDIIWPGDRLLAEIYLGSLEPNDLLTQVTGLAIHVFFRTFFFGCALRGLVSKGIDRWIESLDDPSGISEAHRTTVHNRQ
jgi:hypothetical protein